MPTDDSNIQIETITNDNRSSNNSPNDHEESLKENTSILESITKLIIVPIYACVFLGTLILVLIEFEEIWAVIENFLVIIGLTFVGSGIGVYGVYKWGVISTEVERLNGENNKYEGELNLLKDDASHLKENVRKLQSTVNDLKQDTKELHESLKEFGSLIKSLNELSDENEVFVL